MKDKAKKTTSVNAGKKVFDVMRPGNTAASATSRPVIVGHKPQVKDPMMSEHNADERQLLDGKQKVRLEPAQEEVQTEQSEQGAALPDQATTTAPSVQQGVTAPGATPSPSDPAEGAPQEPHDSPHSETLPTAPPADSPASQLEARSVPPVAIEADQIDQVAASAPPVEEPIPTTPDATQPNVESSPVMPPEPMTNGLVFEEVPKAAPQKQPENAEPLPVLPDEPMPQIIVSHHKPKRKGGKTFLVILVVLLLAAVVFNVLLDAGFLTINGIPHTDFF